MKQALRRIAILLVLGALCGMLGAESLPEIPRSTRVLTLGEVKNYWINILLRKPIPSRPLGLHPERQAAWDRTLETRRSLLRGIRDGQWNTEAELAMLGHNAEAWKRSGNEREAYLCEVRLRSLQEHLSRMRTLEFQREAARAQIDAAEKLSRIEAELSALRAACSSECH